MTRRTRSVLSLLLLGAAVTLIVLHLILDSGSEEAPGWMIYTATAAAVAATLLAAAAVSGR